MWYFFRSSHGQEEESVPYNRTTPVRLSVNKLTGSFIQSKYNVKTGLPGARVISKPKQILPMLKYHRHQGCT